MRSVSGFASVSLRSEWRVALPNSGCSWTCPFVRWQLWFCAVRSTQRVDAPQSVAFYNARGFPYERGKVKCEMV